MMTRHVQLDETADSGQRGLVVLAALALIVGALAGLVGAAFRLALQWADRMRDLFVLWAQGRAALGFLCVILLCAVAAALAAWMVRRFAPPASGSGIPHVEAVLHGEAPPANKVLLPIKFVGGWLAIGAGLALGREGPSVQMGAVIGHLVGEGCGRNWPDCRSLLAAGAGAGLATAFNAPMAGAVFVLEELFQRFEHRMAIAALAASSTAIAVAHLVLGDAPDFHVPPLDYPAPQIGPLFFVLGGLMGVFGVYYNRFLLWTIQAGEALRLPVEARAGLTGAAIGALAWIAPAVVGGGDGLTQSALDGSQNFFLLPLLLLLRFGLGASSYAAGTPGGLFAPLLALGAMAGLFFGIACGLLAPGLDIQPQAFAVVGMAAFFAATVRAPLTGMVLVTEMTGAVVLLLPMLAACFAAMLVPAVLGNEPIYDSLRKRLRGQPRKAFVSEPP